MGLCGREITFPYISSPLSRLRARMQFSPLLLHLRRQFTRLIFCVASVSFHRLENHEILNRICGFNLLAIKRDWRARREVQEGFCMAKFGLQQPSSLGRLQLHASGAFRHCASPKSNLHRHSKAQHRSSGDALLRQSRRPKLRATASPVSKFRRKQSPRK